MSGPAAHPPAVAYRGRFAPSPSGVLHFGSLVAALGSWLRARASGGTWLVRMEDLDPPRVVPGAADAILRTLDAFGLHSDEPIVYQSSRGAAYEAALQRLRDAGLAFACSCSRRDLVNLRSGESALGRRVGGALGDPAGDEAIHRGVCVATLANAGREPAWRLRVPDERVEFHDAVRGRQGQDLREAVGDFVLRRADGPYAYQLAVVVDDAEQRITEVVRGADLLDSTPRQIHLQRTLGLPTPAYLHLPLAVDDSGAKLSKQHASAPVDVGDASASLRRALTFLGFPPALFGPGGSVEATLARALREFDPERIPREHAISVGPLQSRGTADERRT